MIDVYDAIFNPPRACRCGGALIVSSLSHEGPIHCGEEKCELLPRLAPKEGHTPGDLRALHDKDPSVSK